MSTQYIYMLTNGHEIAKARAMTPEQWRDEQARAATATGGTWEWELASTLPVVDGAPIQMKLHYRSDETNGEWRETETVPSDLVEITGAQEQQIAEALDRGEIVRSICCEYRKLA